MLFSVWCLWYLILWCRRNYTWLAEQKLTWCKWLTASGMTGGILMLAFVMLRTSSLINIHIWPISILTRMTPLVATSTCIYDQSPSSHGWRPLLPHLHPYMTNLNPHTNDAPCCHVYLCLCFSTHVYWETESGTEGHSNQTQGDLQELTAGTVWLLSLTQDKHISLCLLYLCVLQMLCETKSWYYEKRDVRCLQIKCYYRSYGVIASFIVITVVMEL